MVAYQKIKFVIALLLFCQFSHPSEGWEMSKSTCRTVTAVSCRVLKFGGEAVIWAAGGGIWRAFARAVAGQLLPLSEVCTPISRSVCGKRRRALTDPSEFEEYEKENAMYLFPQSFSDYESDEAGISIDKFVVGVQNALPGHIHRHSVIDDAFDKADVNDDGFLDMEEFTKGSWIAGDEDVAELKREIIAHGTD